MLKVHHLGVSQSERIVWLCEELGVRYELVPYTRDSVTRLSPPELVALHPLGAAPVIEDGDVMLAESGAIVEYVIARHGGGRLRPATESADFAPFLYWFHLANGTLQPAMMRLMLVTRLKLAADHPMVVMIGERLARLLAHMNARLDTHAHLAGEFSAADVMTVFSLTTMRRFVPVDLEPYPAIRAYLARIGERPAYQRAAAKG